MRAFLMAWLLVFGAGVYAATSQTSFGGDMVSSVFADEGESDEDKEENEDEDEDKDEDEQEKIEEEREKEEAKALKERQKKEQELRKEANKKKMEAMRELEESDDDGDENEMENEDEMDDEDGDGVESKSEAEKKIAEALKEIGKAEEEIAAKQSEGKDVSLATARLAQAKDTLAEAQQALQAGDTEKAKNLANQAKKLANWAKGRDIHSANDSTKILADVSKRIQKTETKLAVLASLGGDTSSFRSALDGAKADLTRAKELINGGSVLEGVVLAEKTERAVKKLKSSIESILLTLGYRDDELGDDHKSEVAKAVEDLLEVADIEEGKLGEKVREIAKNQEHSSDETEHFIQNAQSRGKVAEFILGPKYAELNGIQKQIGKNESQIQSLVQVASQLDDEDLKQAVEDQIEVLKEENAKLSSFIAGKEKERGIFGWVFRLFGE
jgi:hypothetical protein